MPSNQRPDAGRVSGQALEADVRSVSSLTAIVIVVMAALASACGQGSTNPGATAAAVGPAPACPRSGSGARHTVMLTVGDNGRSLCVRPGTGVLVILRGTLGRMWAPVHASSAALMARANGQLMLQAGVTGAYFVAVQPGTVVLSSARPGCAGAAGATASPPSPGTARCGAERGFRVTVVVRR
jgi:hypothetical protein